MIDSVVWNPWHGCVRYSEGCLNCYVYRIDGKIEKDASEIKKNEDFDLPLKKSRNGEYKIKPGTTVYTCLSSDFFLDAADEWRGDAWKIIAERQDLKFIIITKRITRFYSSLPADFADGYDNVTVCATCENARRADERIPVLLSLPLKHREIICEPLLGRIDLSPYLGEDGADGGKIERVTVGGESGEGARVCDYDWVLGIRDNCVAAGVGFRFKQTGANFRKNGKIYKIPRKYQSEQAKKAGIDTV